MSDPVSAQVGQKVDRDNHRECSQAGCLPDHPFISPPLFPQTSSGSAMPGRQLWGSSPPRVLKGRGWRMGSFPPGMPLGQGAKSETLRLRETVCRQGPGRCRPRHSTLVAQPQHSPGPQYFVLASPSCALAVPIQVNIVCKLQSMLFT